MKNEFFDGVFENLSKEIEKNKLKKRKVVE